MGESRGLWGRLGVHLGAVGPRGHVRPQDRVWGDPCAPNGSLPRGSATVAKTMVRELVRERVMGCPPGPAEPLVPTQALIPTHTPHRLLPADPESGGERVVLTQRRPSGSECHPRPRFRREPYARVWCPPRAGRLERPRGQPRGNPCLNRRGVLGDNAKPVSGLPGEGCGELSLENFDGVRYVCWTVPVGGGPGGGPKNGLFFDWLAELGREFWAGPALLEKARAKARDRARVGVGVGWGGPGETGETGEAGEPRGNQGSWGAGETRGRWGTGVGSLRGPRITLEIWSLAGEAMDLRGWRGPGRAAGVWRRV